jgi:hypothetical protein
MGTLIVLGPGASLAHAAFTTVINAPPASTEGLDSIGSNTQLNLYEGASLSRLSLGNIFHPTSNIEVNVYGGTIGDSFYTGQWNSTASDVVINIFGGEIGRRFGIAPGVVANWSGGSLGPEISTRPGSQLNISGGDYRLDGIPIAGLLTTGDSVALNLPAKSVLTGTLTDGTPFAISNQSWQDYITDGTLTLHTAPIPAAIPTAFHSPRDPVPRGLRAGQSLTVADGGVVGNNFNANWGSVVTVAGGQVGENFEAIGAVVNISGGSIRGLATAFSGSVFNLSGGSIGNNFHAFSGSVVNITGGAIEHLFEAFDGSVVNLSGGAIDDTFWAHAGSQLNISGGEFRLNGVPISGLNEVGSTRAFDFPDRTVLSGTLADGTPFAFADQDYDVFDAGTVTLRAAPLPAASPAVFHVPTDPAPKGLRTGQTLIVENGGALGDRFNANWGSMVTINGGQVDNYFEAVGALVNIAGGTIGGGFDAFYGSVINISGGTIGGVFTANRGSVVNISGGSFGAYFHAYSGSVVNIAGGTIGNYAYAFDGSIINVSGGSIGNDFSAIGTTINMSGGTIGDHLSASAMYISGGAIGDHFTGGQVKISGSDFRLNGVPISGLDLEYFEVVVDVPTGSVLSGTLADGTPFAFSSQDGDNLVEGRLHLQAREPPAPGPATIHVPGRPAPLGIRARQSLVVGTGGIVGDNFRAGWGSVVTVTGGQIGDNFEAVGAQVTIVGGTVGDGFDAFYGSVVNISGGSVGETFQAHRGSIVNVTGGEIGWGFSANSDSVVNLSGGNFRDGFAAAPGSEFHLFGYGFQLDGVEITNLIPGQMLEITDRNVTLSGLLADGSTFRLGLYRSMYPLPDGVDSVALVTVTSVLSGDYNYNGVVDAADYVLWRQHLGTALTLVNDATPGVSAADYDVWKSQFGNELSGAAALVAIPEPSAILLVAVVSLTMLGGRRRTNWSSAYY